MTRLTSAAVGSYVTEPVLDFRVLADVTFSNTTMRLHTGLGPLAVGTTVYDGIGALGGVDKISENADTFAPGVKLYLSAVHTPVMQETIGETLFGKAVVLKRCWVREGTVVGSAEVWYRGQIGGVTLHRGDSERGSYVEVELETKLQRTSRQSYYTKENLQAVYSGDTFFNYTHLIGSVKALWGDREVRFSDYRTFFLLGKQFGVLPKKKG